MLCKNKSEAPENCQLTIDLRREQLRRHAKLIWVNEMVKKNEHTPEKQLWERRQEDARNRMNSINNIRNTFREYCSALRHQPLQRVSAKR